MTTATVEQIVALRDDRQARIEASGFLYRINPLAKLAASLVPMLVLLSVRDVLTPLIVIVLAGVTLVVGCHPRPRLVVMTVLGTVLACVWSAFVFAVLAAPDPDGPSAAYTGTATTLRIAALISVAMLSGAGTTPNGFASALVHQLRIPYRFAYGAVAAMSFLRVFRRDAAQIRLARRARGIVQRSGLGALGTSRGLFVPLMAGAIRHAERVSLSMDSRGFAADRNRTEPQVSRWRLGDTGYLIAVTAVFALIVFAAAMVGDLSAEWSWY